MSFEDFFQAEILIIVEWSGAYLFPHERTNFTFGDILIIIWLAPSLSLLSQLETSVSLAADYSK